MWIVREDNGGATRHRIVQCSITDLRHKQTLTFHHVSDSQYGMLKTLYNAYQQADNERRILQDKLDSVKACFSQK